MHPIIYDVAVSLDGYISGPSGDISLFAQDGPVVDDYTRRLGEYSTAIMGRATYEFGYAYGLKAGQNPYPHMKTIVFSKSLQCPDNAGITVKRSTREQDILELKASENGPIYLCGGGEFAGWLLQRGLIDRVILKRAPCVYAGGVRLFGETPTPSCLSRINTTVYDSGYLLEEFVTQSDKTF